MIVFELTKSSLLASGFDCNALLERYGFTRDRSKQGGTWWRTPDENNSSLHVRPGGAEWYCHNGSFTVRSSGGLCELVWAIDPGTYVAGDDRASMENALTRLSELSGVPLVTDGEQETGQYGEKRTVAAERRVTMPAEIKDVGQASQPFTADDAGMIEFEINRFNMGKPAGVYIIHNATGDDVGRFIRWDNPDGKEFRYLSKQDNVIVRRAPVTPGGIAPFVASSNGKQAPFDSLREIGHNAAVVFVEGEKTALACGTLLRGRFSGIPAVAVTTMGGSKKVSNTCFSFFHHIRTFYLVPDNDKSGTGWAADVVRSIKAVAPSASIRQVDYSRYGGLFVTGWDVADQWPGTEFNLDRLLRDSRIVGAPEKAVAHWHTTSEETAMDIAAKACDSGCKLFNRSGKVTMVARDAFTGEAYMKALDAETLKPVLSRYVQFTREVTGRDGTSKSISDDLPVKAVKSMVAMAISTPDQLPFPAITSISTTPVMGSDGRLHTSGLHGDGVYVACDLPLGRVDDITPDTVPQVIVEARKVLQETIKDFSFQSSSERAGLLSAMFTGAVRSQLRAAPGFSVCAPSKGAGKTLAVRMVSMLASGGDPYTIPYGEKEETEKRIDTALIEGRRVILFDNVPNGNVFKSETMCTLLTEPVYHPRIMHSQSSMTVSTRATWFYTGNNSKPADDLVRRFIRIVLDTKTEYAWQVKRSRTESEFIDYLRQNRAEILTAIYRVIRAYQVSRQKPEIQVLPSYDQWAEWVQGPVALLTGHDVAASQRPMEDDDPAKEQIRQFMASWVACFGVGSFGGQAGVSEYSLNSVLKKAKAAHDIVEKAERERSDTLCELDRKLSELYDVMSEVTGGRLRDVFALKNWWNSNLNVRVDGKQLRKSDAKETTRGGQRMYGVFLEDAPVERAAPVAQVQQQTRTTAPVVPVQATSAGYRHPYRSTHLDDIAAEAFPE